MSAVMKLSEAIRAGAKLRPQGFGSGLERKPGTSCATLAAGEAFLGVMCRDEVQAYKVIKNAGIDTCNIFLTKCPQCDSSGFSLWCLCIHLNDTHRWSREEIADWLQREGF